MTFAVGQTQKSNANAHEVTSPLRQKLECKCKAETTHSVHDPTKGTQSRKNPNLKQIARQMAQHQTQVLDTEMLTLDIAVGSKRPGIVESLEFKENRTQNDYSLLPPPLTPLPLIAYRRWLPCNITGSNDCPWMELPGTWEPPDS